MKLGSWGWGLNRLSLARFQRNRAIGFGESAKKWVVFCDVNHAPILPLSFDRFPPNLPRTRAHVASRDTRFHITENFPIRGRISRKTDFLGYFRVPCLWSGHGKCSATPKLFPSPRGHPTDLSFLGDFCCGVYCFPAIHVRTSSFATV